MRTERIEACIEEVAARRAARDGRRQESSVAEERLHLADQAVNAAEEALHRAVAEQIDAAQPATVVDASVVDRDEGVTHR